MAKLVSGREYKTDGGESKFQAILGGGTATLSVKTSKGSAFVSEYTWPGGDKTVIVDLPVGKYKVELTGAAEVTTG